MKLINNVSIDKYNDFVLNHPFSNIMQTSYWAKVKEPEWSNAFLLFEEDNKIVASAMLLKRKAFLNNYLFYAPRGFICNYNNETQVSKVIELLKKYVKDNNGFVLIFDPEIVYDKYNSRTFEKIDNNYNLYEMLKKYANSRGLSKNMDSSYQPRYQMVVNLKDDEISNKIKSKKRRLIKNEYLEKRGYEIIEDTSLKGVSEFARLSKITEQRQNISLRNEAYFKKMYETFNEINGINIYFAKLNIDKLIEYNNDNIVEINRLIKLKEVHGNEVYTNAIICINKTKMVQMFYGASDDDFSMYKAGYALHFYAMVEAKERGYDYFNLGGVPGTFDDGLFRFKSEYNPEVFEYVGDFEIIIKPLINDFFNISFSVYKKLRGMLKK